MTPIASKSALVLRGISRSFGQVKAVDGVSLEVEDGQFISLLGPSGCGKTTLLRIISGFEIPDAGEVLLDGSDIVRVPVHKRPMNMVFQRYALFPHMTVFENVAFSQALKRVPRQEINRKVAEMLDLVQLRGYEDRKPSQLSGGQCQRVALVRALINQPRVLLLDEPLGALDMKIRKQMQIELRRIQQRLGITFIYVTHDQEEALVMSDRVVLMNGGRVEQDDTPSRIYHHPASRFAATFIGESNILECTVTRVRPDALLELDCGGTTFTVSPLTGARAGDHVSLAIRLDKVRRLAGTTAMDNQIQGTIEDVVFYGSIIKFAVSLPGGVRLLVEEKLPDEGEGDSIREKNVGEPVRIGFCARDVNVFPAGVPAPGGAT